ncbi:MAG TPA: phosphoribosyltransferase family protein [Saprospiraceae bacterium]|nr:phosphoribosyltransferase family protein [Saprospiraceae bacterium]
MSEGKLSESLKGRHVLLVEDIIDSGLTIKWITEKLQSLGVASITVATLLLKPDAIEYPVQIDYVGFEIPNNFVVGYGLDYNGKGRNLKSIYTLVE